MSKEAFSVHPVKFDSLNGLRAISILLVMINHLESQYQIFQGLKAYRLSWPLVTFLTDGQLGVNVFFVISGFLITSLMLEELARTQRVSLKDFYIRRTLRIFPAYYFLLLIYFILQWQDILFISKPSWLTALTYTKYFNWKLDWYTAHAWSLSIEEQFYLFWPLIFVTLPRLRTIFPVLLFLLVPIIRIYAHRHPVPYVDDLSIFERIDAIALGCFFALQRGWILERLKAHWSAVFWGSVLVLLIWENLGAHLPELSPGVRQFFVPLGTSNGTIINLAIGLIMMYSVFGPTHTWHAFLNHPVINYIGMLSYSLYLWQQFFLYQTGQWYNSLPLNISMVVLASLFSYYVIERPFLRIKNRFSNLATSRSQP